MTNSELMIPLITFVVVALLTPVLIWGLRTLKLTQPIRTELPADHQAKRGTPLMAGLVLLVGIVSLFYSHTSTLTLFLGSTFILFSIVGFIDDFKKALFQDPSGVSGKTKLILQFTFTITLLLALFRFFSANSNIYIPGHTSIQLNLVVYFILMLLFIVGSANAINFTDGLDGLLIMVAIPSYFFFVSISNHYEVQLFCLIMIACLLGLFLYNIYPAKAFMGDTGSLAIGGSLAFLAIVEKVEILTPILFFVYFAEQLSVILQVCLVMCDCLLVYLEIPDVKHIQ
jgi:phospho-N-acetylmuramoyl-pentapeptide-transferase